MELLADNEGKRYEAITIDRFDEFVSPFPPGLLFPCMIWDHEGRFGDSERSAVAKALLDAGCRYAVCGGQQCKAWHDSVDREFILKHSEDSDEVQEAAFIMTSWHDGENPDDVAFFFVLNTNFDHHDFGRYLVLHVGSGSEVAQVNAAVRKYALNKGEV